MKSGRPSSTALLIARSTVVMARHPRFGELIPPESARWCERFVRDHLRFATARLPLYRGAAYRRLAATMEALTLPGVQLHYAVRKRWIETKVRSALGDGMQELRVVGAGFDTLALRLAAEHPARRVIEVDHPDTQTAKRFSVTRRSLQPSNFSFRCLDLAAAAPTPKKRDTTGAVVVAEGVLMYLEEDDVLAFFRRLRQEHSGPLQVVFTYMAPDATGRIRFHNASRFVDRWLDLKGEPFRWGIEPARLSGFLDRAGFRLRADAGHEELAELFLNRLEGATPEVAEPA